MSRDDRTRSLSFFGVSFTGTPFSQTSSQLRPGPSDLLFSFFFERVTRRTTRAFSRPFLSATPQLASGGIVSDPVLLSSSLPLNFSPFKASFFHVPGGPLQMTTGVVNPRFSTARNAAHGSTVKVVCCSLQQVTFLPPGMAFPASLFAFSLSCHVVGLSSGHSSCCAV